MTSETEVAVMPVAETPAIPISNGHDHTHKAPEAPTIAPVVTEAIQAPVPKPRAMRVKLKARPIIKARGKRKLKANPKRVKTAKATRKAVKPAERQTLPLDRFGFRAGSLKSKAAGMYASTKGATLREVRAKLGSPQLNLLKALEDKGHKVLTEKVKGKRGQRAVTRYYLELRA